MSKQAAETQVTYAQLLAYAVGLEAPDILWGPSFAAGTRIWLRKKGFWRAYLVTDLAAPSSTTVTNTVAERLRNSLDSAFVLTPSGTGALGSTSQRLAVAAELWIQDGTNTGNPVTSARPVPTVGGTLDSVNDAYLQTAFANVATQLIASGVLYQDLKIKNIGGNVCYLGFDNLVVAGSGYELSANLAAESEIIFSGFNANLWGISNIAGTTVSILARG